MALMSENGTALDRENFEEFYIRWKEKQNLHPHALISTATEPSPSSSLPGLVDRVLSHYKEYYRVNSKCSDILLILSAPWKTALEDAFNWVGGWRPSAAFHLLYSKSGLQLEAKLAELMKGEDMGDLSDLSSAQLSRMDKLQRITIQQEREVSEKVADQEMVELSRDVSETEGANSTPMRSSYSSEVLQLLSSDHPGLILVSSPLDGKNFLAWSRAVRRALGAKSKLGFITGACRKPTGDPELIEQWTRVDCMVASWLLNTMTKNISNAFIYAKSARTLWIDLEQRYGQRNGPLLYQLEREIASVSQGDLSIVDYFTKIQMLWDELVQVRPIPECTCGCTCTCGVAKATADLAEQRQLMQFLMGLNDEYDTVRSQILVNEPLPSVNVAYSMVLRVEKQRQVHLAEPHEGAAMHAVTYDKKKELNSFRRRGVVDKRNLKCVHCDRTGHDKSTCFKLHGVPEWYKELNDQKKKGNTGTKAYAVQGTSQKDTKKEETISVSDCVMEFMRVLKHIPNVLLKNCVDEYAGTDFTFSGTEHLTEDTWIIDSRATSHMCSNPNAFHNLHPSASISSIFLPDGSTKQTQSIRLVNLFGKLKLTDTLYVPSFVSRDQSDDSETARAVDSTLKHKEEDFQLVVQSAAYLRLTTLKGVVNILSPIQAVHFN
ncbi:UNVERIFIED_CONTAM: Transcription factor TGA5 [Sesamum angustifolium]|uniref:Transcription factor TGA5 n=1 Tax=Sesamum angustifolium TaxID=2727405 RepID=A0AAW2LYL5_9LAMI